MKRIFGNIVAFAAALTIGLVAAEVIVRNFVTVSAVGPNFSEYHPVYGKHLKPSFSARRRTPEFEMVITTNAFGFRGAPIEQFPNEPVLFLGDSFTMGYGVNNGEEFPSLISARLATLAEPVPVVNMGVGKSGNGRWVKILNDIEGKVSPRLVVLQFLDNDFADNERERLFSIDDKGALQEHPVPPPGRMQRLQSIVDAVPGLSSTYLLALARQVVVARNRSQPAEPGAQSKEVNDVLTFRIVEEVLAICERNNWPVLGVVVGLDEHRRSGIENILAQNQIDFVSLPAKPARPDLYYEIDGHWNADGQKHASQVILEKMDQMGFETAQK